MIRLSEVVRNPNSHNTCTDNTDNFDAQNTATSLLWQIAGTKVKVDGCFAQMELQSSRLFCRSGNRDVINVRALMRDISNRAAIKQLVHEFL